MELEISQRFEALEARLIDALAEARVARILAEKALNTQTAIKTDKVVGEPWIPPLQSEGVPAAPFIRVEEKAPKPSLAGFYNRVGKPEAAKTSKEPSSDVADDLMWDEIVGTMGEE